MDIHSWPHDIHVVGLGGIGTEIVKVLIQQGARKLILWDQPGTIEDPDAGRVKAHNIGTQFLFRPSDIGRFKTDAVLDFLVRQEYDVQVTVRTQTVTGADRKAFKGLVITGVDSMASRKEIWKCMRNNVSVHHFFDGRIGDDVMQLHSLNPSDPSLTPRYEGWLRGADTDANQRGCTTREKPYSAHALAAEVSSQLPLIMEGEPVKDYVYRDLRQESRARLEAAA